MVDARLPPYPLAEKARIPESFVHSSSIPSPTDYYNESEPQLSLQIKKEIPPFASRDSGADYEYLERRLREFGTQKPPTHISSPTARSTSPAPNPSNSSGQNNTNLNSRGGDNDLISLARAVESNSGCKLAKCVVCERGLPESFHMQKPVSWLSVCKLAMWALTQDGAAYGRKWFSLGRDICPFVEVHKYVCGREFTPNWKTTIGITMSTYAKRANMFIAGNPNELGLGYYMLPDDATDPYLETAPLIIGRHYRTPNPHSQQSHTPTRMATPPATPIPSSPPHGTASIINAPSTPPHSSHLRPGTPPRRPPSPHRSTTPTRRSVTPPPRTLTPPPQRALTPPPSSIHVLHASPIPSPSHISPRSQSPHTLPPHSVVPQPSPSTPHGSPNSEMSSEVSAYMNDPACLMGVIRMRRKRFNGEMQRRAIGERKHTTDNERQLLLDYYDKFGTCTTVPEFTELQHRLGWDAHRTKIWLYNRKTYHHHRPGEKRKKPRTNPSSPHDGSSYDNDSDEEMYYAEESYSSHADDNDREKSDMDEESQHEYILDLEHMVNSLKRQLEVETQDRKAEHERTQANAEKIVDLEKALSRAEAQQDPSDVNSELALLRRQVELYFNDLREEKKKRAQEEIKSLDYLAQINSLNLRIATLEKMLQSSASPTGEPTTPTITNAPNSTAKIDSQGRKVFDDNAPSNPDSPRTTRAAKESSIAVPVSPSSDSMSPATSSSSSSSTVISTATSS